jgi:hypothetical protein
MPSGRILRDGGREDRAQASHDGEEGVEDEDLLDSVT